MYTQMFLALACNTFDHHLDTVSQEYKCETSHTKKCMYSLLAFYNQPRNKTLASLDDDAYALPLHVTFHQH